MRPAARQHMCLGGAARRGQSDADTSFVWIKTVAGIMSCLCVLGMSLALPSISACRCPLLPAETPHRGKYDKICLRTMAMSSWLEIKCRRQELDERISHLRKDVHTMKDALYGGLGSSAGQHSSWELSGDSTAAVHSERRGRSRAASPCTGGAQQRRPAAAGRAQ